jgi:hypothetical protein
MTKPPYLDSASIQPRIEPFADKAEKLGRWLAENAPHCEQAQRHLDEDSIEQGYWHYGYLCAIKDILGSVQSDLCCTVLSEAPQLIEGRDSKQASHPA